jgi:hypothetical protein
MTIHCSNNKLIINSIILLFLLFFFYVYDASFKKPLFNNRHYSMLLPKLVYAPPRHIPSFHSHCSPPLDFISIDPRSRCSISPIPPPPRISILARSSNYTDISVSNDAPRKLCVCLLLPLLSLPYTLELGPVLFVVKRSMVLVGMLSLFFEITELIINEEDTVYWMYTFDDGASANTFSPRHWYTCILRIK